jgi:bifunctional non-homologous end joining protein LigD
MAIRPKTTDVKFTNLAKVFFPEKRFTKGELISYYLAVSRYILPHLKDRPVTLIRFPDGIEGEKFYEKNIPSFAPSWIKTRAVDRRHDSGKTQYIVINDAATLAWCANIAAIELHPFLHRTKDLNRPTHVVFDLDPGDGADLLTCARVAFLVREILDGLGLKAFPKVSGSKGLQLYVPLNTRVNYETTGAFAKSVAELLEQRHPDLVVSKMDKLRRRHRVLIDWSQNSISKTTAAVYSMRGKSRAPFISMPVTWQELQRVVRTRKKSSLFFSPEVALQRLKKSGDLFAPVLKLKQTLPRAFVQLTPKEPSRPQSSLAKYEAKRDFTQTAEPRSNSSRKARPAKGGARFVIQKHDASHLHYDFRLEMDGTLKSWAIPKGIPTELGVKRSAFAVEDHPLGYMKFEGTIPKGQYGGGTVMVWDIGTYELLGGDYADGNLKLKLTGKKLKGEWHMFRIRSDENKPVWLIAKSGKAAKSISARQDNSSALTRRSMARIAKDNDAQWQSRSR